MLTDKQEKKYTKFLTDEYSSENYNIKFTAFKEGFLLIDFRGYANLDDINLGFEKRNAVIEAAGFDKKEYFEIWDFVYLPKTSREGRLLISEYLSVENKNLLAIIYTNCSILQQITLRTGFSFIENKYTINTIKKDNQTAIEFGVKLLSSDKEKRSKILFSEIESGSLTRNYTVNNFFEIWRQKSDYLEIFNHNYERIKNEDWCFYSVDKSFISSIEVIDSNIFHITLNGELTPDSLDKTFKLKNNIINLLGLNKSTIYQIFDFTKVNTSSINKHYNYFLDLMNLPFEMNNNTVIITKKISEIFLKFKNKKSLKKIVLKNNFESAFHYSLIIKECLSENNAKDLIIPSKKKDKDLLIQLMHDKINRQNTQYHSEIEEIIKMLSQISWDKYNNPIQLKKASSERLENVFYAVKLIFDDNQQLLREFQENNIKLNDAIIELKKNAIESSVKENSFSKYKEIYDNFVDTYFEISLDGKVLEISNNIEIILPIKRYDLIGQSIFDYITNDNRVKKAYCHLIENKRISNFLLNISDNNNKVYTFSLHAKITNSYPNKIVGTLREISMQSFNNTKGLVNEIKGMLNN